MARSALAILIGTMLFVSACGVAQATGLHQAPASAQALALSSEPSPASPSWKVP